MPKPELVSFSTCPFVQRSVITLIEKNVDFDITYIDLANKPDWFLKISPFGKVPVLKIGETVLFESAVINEYLDEINPPSMHPSDPLQKAHNRAWIEFGSALNMDMFKWAMADSKENFETNQKTMADNIAKLEEQLDERPYFNGDAFSLIDAAFAPFFMRLQFIEKRFSGGFLAKLPKTKAWSEALLNRPSVQKSVVDTIEQEFIDYIKNRDVYLAKQL